MSGVQNVRPVVYGADYWALVCVATCGLCANCTLSAALVCVRRLRLARGANCFALHHLALHAALAAYCVPFAAGVSRETPLPHCELLGSALLFALALVPFNLLAYVYSIEITEYPLKIK